MDQVPRLLLFEFTLSLYRVDVRSPESPLDPGLGIEGQPGHRRLWLVLGSAPREYGSTQRVSDGPANRDSSAQATAGLLP
jgi:hypothetical protein